MTLKQENLTLKHRDKLFFIGQSDLSLLYWKNLNKETTFFKIYFLYVYAEKFMPNHKWKQRAMAV